MLKYILERETDNEMVYRYFPEGKSESGLVSYDKNTGELSVIELAPGELFRTYALKMFYKIRTFINNGVFRQSGIVAWY